jgi:hypothetical protein
MELITQAAAHPDQLFAPEILTMPPGTGLSAQSAQQLGLQLVISATRAALELAVWQSLDKRGWTNADKDRLLTEVSNQIRAK